MKSTKKGFTLVELLVVIAILAILATVSVVGYTAFIEKAHQSVAMQEMTQIRNALVAEDITNDGFDLSDGIDGSSTIVVASTQGAQGTPSEAENVLNFVQTLGIAGTYKVTGGGALQFSPEGKDATATCDFVTGEITTEKGTIACDHQWQEATCELPQTCTLCGETSGEPAGHDYDVATYVWSEDKATCTATRICKTDSAHVETEVVDVVATVTQEQACLKAELTTYTATFTNTAFETQTQADIETKPALEHAWTDDNDTECDRGCGTTREIAPKLINQAVVVARDIFDLENKTEFVIDFSENVINTSNLELTYSVMHNESALQFQGTSYTFEFGSYTDTATAETFDVTITCTVNGQPTTLSYTYTLNLKDTTKYKLANGDFEKGLDGWTKVGEIGNVSSNGSYWNGEFGMDGERMFSAYEPDDVEKNVGTLTSSTFTVGGSGFVTFKIGAMQDGNYMYVDVVDASTKEILARYYNHLWKEDETHCTLVAYKADLSAFMGEEVFFRICDNADSGYGLIFADSFITYYENAPEGFNDATQDYAVSGTIYDVFNGGFEMGNVQGWWNKGEIGVVTNASEYWEANKLYGKDGEYLFTGVQSFGADTMREGNTGTLTSSVFQLGGEGYISYMLGGGNELCYVQVIDATTNEVLAMYRQQAREDAVLKTYVANLSAYIGRTIRIQLVDNAIHNWGCVSFDNVVTYHTTIPTGIEAIDVKEAIKYEIVNGSFENGLYGWEMDITEAGTHNTLGWVLETEIDIGWYNKNDGRKDGNYLFTFVQPGDINCENSTGTLTSSTFTLKKDAFVSFRFGGAGTRNVHIQLCNANGDVIATFYNEAPGKANTEMYAYYYQYTGETADCFFRVVDNANGSPYGCFVVDDFRVNLESAPEGFIAAIQ